MAEKKSKTSRRWILVAIALAIAGFFGFQWWKAAQSALPKGIAYGNGRIEARLVDASAKEPLRVKAVLVNEGDLVKPGQVLVQLDASTLESQLAEAKAQVAAAQERLVEARAAIVRTKSQIRLATIEAERTQKLVEDKAASQRELDVRTTTVETTKASLAEPGEVLGPGGKALTIVNLQDVYMEIFLPSKEAAALRTGAEARLTVDYLPGRAAAGFVSFVSPEAQFTPKQVETRTEREKLMFRVKIQVPPELVAAHLDRIRTGVRGVGYVKVDERAAWPSWLDTNLLKPGERLPGEGAVEASAGPGVAPAAAETTAPEGQPPAASTPAAQAPAASTPAVQAPATPTPPATPK